MHIAFFKQLLDSGGFVRVIPITTHKEWIVLAAGATVSRDAIAFRGVGPGWKLLEGDESPPVVYAGPRRHGQYPVAARRTERDFPGELDSEVRFPVGPCHI